ncbi:BrxA/BrxB family bacilliredoxin [Chitinophaga nivalis]|uniref:BrxA/BrxB family bacilliredoxin n=1 Tax=Chitinophaga nivalis TaxID=2991709 RepID=A0ABT3IKX7_9BACT|nr:BrxA/BrxB family bacilliredoxin [Chitinophaga nivalis]MCW3465743.1 BrxA/BrxB family bacilliredoxin [Chitinophaga nivalis]MCW3484566.1 BrxA/BrxB family bacilliredoxin [Chitinophaga nivalis]
MPYSPLLVKPFREELTDAGVRELITPEDVDKVMGQQTGTTLVVINSVCGCAAGTARPGIQKALEHTKKPDQTVSVFAGQDLEATARIRSYFPDIPPSSPAFAFFKDGELVYFIPKHRIESRDANAIANDLIAAFDEFC